jgi:hypothetical protein
MVGEQSQKILTLITHIGCFKVRRLYGIASAPAIFQQITTILENIQGLFVYLDDILISGKSQQEGYERLLQVLKRFSVHGVRVNQDKCMFLTVSVNYLGFTIDKKGLHLDENRLKGIQEVKKPANLSELRYFFRNG